MENKLTDAELSIVTQFIVDNTDTVLSEVWKESFKDPAKHFSPEDQYAAKLFIQGTRLMIIAEACSKQNIDLHITKEHDHNYVVHLDDFSETSEYVADATMVVLHTHLTSK